ncbi:MAG: phosphoglycerate transporter protein PgtP [Pirellulaceae bacterium]|nr:phosphoglycerate transporter protein PgtP [Pirellulaceae bacterium]
MFSFLKPAVAASPLPPDRVSSTYRRLRIQVFAGIFIGYAAYYLVRKNFSLAIPDIMGEHPEYTKAQLGMAMTGLSFAYGLSKFLMGSVSDRSNARGFLTIGLLLSCSITLLFGFVPAIYTSLTLMIALMALNGWVQGMGWPPCGKTMVHWFSTRERGRVVATWNIAHNVGGGLVAGIALAGVALTGEWSAKFYFNAFIALLLAVVTWLLMRDTPQSSGLPPIEVYRNDYPPDYSEHSERTLSFRQIFIGHVLNNPFLWAIAVANAFAYFVRYGIVDWVPTYLQIEKGFSFKDSSVAWSLFEYAAIPGTLLCGWVSDRIFGGRRAPATILFMGLTLLGVVMYSLNRQGPLWIDQLALITIGFFVYGPIMMIGLHALDLVPKKAAGTAAGFTGFFGYVFGSAVAGTGVGWIADRFGWNGVFVAMIVCCIATMACCALTLSHRADSHSRDK